MWVRAMEVYGKTVKVVAPKRAQAEAAQQLLTKKEASLADSRAHLATVLAKVDDLKVMCYSMQAQDIAVVVASARQEGYCC